MIFGTAYAQQGAEAQSTILSNGGWLGQPLFWIEVGLLFLILLVAPIYAIIGSKSNGSSVLKGLNLPEGSVRAILALLIVGSFVNVLVFGPNLLGGHFEQVVTAFGTLAGAFTGFYFAGRNRN